MAVTVSKRQQARNERQLQELTHGVAGNDRCADCSTKNPGWASWSFGVFLCVRCATLHRKLGTHVSKVKSLSMDSWSADQVDNMKKVGNLKSNAIYNPKNVKPDIPIDADEVDSAMERFIRQKYELRTLSTNKPAIRQNTGSTGSGSWNEDPPPLPPKPKKFLFGFRSASTTATPVSKQDRFTPPLSPQSAGDRSEPDFDLASKSKPSQMFGMKITSVSNNFDQKLAHLRDMGFNDPRRNSEILKSSNGNLDKAVETLVRLGEGSKPVPPPRTLTPVSMGSSGGIGISIEKPAQTEKQLPETPAEAKADAPQRSSSLPVPPRSQSAGPTSNSWNPFLTDTQPQTQNLESHFQNLAISQTGPPQQQQIMQQPAVPQIPQQYQNNPFQAYQLQSNPWQQQQPVQQPFMSGTAFAPAQPLQAQSSAPLQFNQSVNPFLQPSRSLTDSPSNPWATQSPATLTQQSSPWSSQVQSPASMSQQSANPFGQSPAWQPQQNIFSQPATSSPAPVANQQEYFSQQQQQQQQQPLQAQLPQQRSFSHGQPLQPSGLNPWQQQQPPPQQQYQQPFPPQFNQQPQMQPLPPQPMRHDKNSILALYNMPQPTPWQPLQTLQEDPTQQQQFQPQPQRSVTMPVQQSNIGAMNPFMGVGAPQSARHVSNESRDFVGLGAGASGRHSPDAFSSLSAHYMR